MFSRNYIEMCIAGAFQIEYLRNSRFPPKNGMMDISCKFKKDDYFHHNSMNPGEVKIVLDVIEPSQPAIAMIKAANDRGGYPAHECIWIPTRKQMIDYSSLRGGIGEITDEMTEEDILARYMKFFERKIWDSSQKKWVT